jgi:hypothetical protein
MYPIKSGLVKTFDKNTILQISFKIKNTAFYLENTTDNRHQLLFLVFSKCQKKAGLWKKTWQLFWS